MHLDHLTNCMISQSSHCCEKIVRLLLVCGTHSDSYRSVRPIMELEMLLARYCESHHDADAERIY